MKALSYEILHNFTCDLFIKAGCKKEDALVVADVLMSAELRGIPSHGLMRVADYISLFEAGRITIQPEVRTIHDTPGTATVDAGNGFGMIGAKFAMQLAIEKAEKTGTGWVSIINSNHFGIAGYYSMMAVEKNMIGFAMTNANPLVAPTWSTSRFLGTNPIAVAVPAGSEPAFVADFATTPVARGKLALKEKAGEEVPPGYVQDNKGNPSTDPGILKNGGAIVPLGGDYEHGSHKGYCMGAIVDILSAVTGGANFGPFVPPQVGYLPLHEKSTGKGLGHFVGAMRIDAFRPASDFKASMDEWIRTFRNASPSEGQSRVLVPGDPEREAELKHKKEGILLQDSVVKDLDRISKKYGVDFAFSFA
jgi:LDH2 family malate/lactate/ureidoglycolate dehydrogenase